MKLQIIEGINQSSKLTVTRDGDIRIKLAKDILPLEKIILLGLFIEIALKIIDLNPCHTLRGVATQDSIEMWNNAHTHKHVFKFKELIR